MRTTLSLLALALLLTFAQPAQAQLRADLGGPAPTQVYGQGGSASLLSRLVQSGRFRMSHSVEFSTTSVGGQALSLGMYTNTMMVQLNDHWAARADVAVATSPFGGNDAFGMSNQPRVFLRNAEVAYRPNDNFQVRLQVRQNPFGGMMNPYMNPYGMGMGRGMGGMARMGMGSTPTNQLFWRN